MIENTTINLIRKILKTLSRTESTVDAIMDGKPIRAITRGASLVDDLIELGIDVKRRLENATKTP